MKKETKNETNTTLKDLSGIQLVDFGGSTGFSCDVETGICGPVDQAKEEDEK